MLWQSVEGDQQSEQWPFHRGLAVVLALDNFYRLHLPGREGLREARTAQPIFSDGRMAESFPSRERPQPAQRDVDLQSDNASVE